jgi:hypothetical protein
MQRKEGDDMTIGYGSLLRAKPGNPIHARGGDGIAFVTDADADGFTFQWVTGDPATPGFSGDTGSIRHLDAWFDVVPEDEAARCLPEGFMPPPNPREDPAAAFMALFGFDAAASRP